MAEGKAVIVALTGLSTEDAQTALTSANTTQEGLGFVLDRTEIMKREDDEGQIVTEAFLTYKKPTYLTGPGGDWYSVFSEELVDDGGAVEHDAVTKEIVSVGDALAHTINLPSDPSDGDHVLVKNTGGVNIAAVVDADANNIEQTDGVADATTYTFNNGAGAFVEFTFFNSAWWRTALHLPAAA